jgi:SAM-dependent methyltransferase
VGDGGADPRRQTPAQLLAQLYDWEHDSFTADVDLYASLAQRTGGPILEPACGTGRVLEPLARRGLHVVGFDSSPVMLARARERLENLGPRTKLSQANLLDPLPTGSFHMVLLALDALGLVSDTAAQIALLRRIRLAMADDALLVLDLVHAASLWDQPQGVPVLQQAAGDDELGARVSKWVVRRLLPSAELLVLDCFYDLTWPDGSFTRLEESVRLRYFSRYELDLLLTAADLRVEGIHGDYSLEPFQDDSPRMIVLAAR